jgi:acetyl-CoA carboxylase biotin carboxyl carrier protein
MDHDEIKKIIEFLKDTDVTELLIEREGSKLKIKREKYLYHAGPTPPPVVPPIPSGVEETVKESVDEHYISISSPIVGIFHRSPSPEAPPYVDVGTVVKKGQVLCIVEAMKLMNEIESDTDGIIRKIPVENGQPVEYGETLFLIEPSS